MELVLLFPGQGSQKPGMGRDLADAFPAAREVFQRADAALGAPLSRLCFDGPADELTLTHNAQPALLAHSAAAWAVTRDRIGDRVVAVAGHSLGEFTAYHAAGALDLEAALRLVRRRGELMYESGVQRPGAMAAILGEMNESADDVCRTATERAGLVVPANFNSPGQVVISGEVAGVECAMALSKAAGARRAIRLPVSGAFHSPLMETAVAGLAEALEAAPFKDPDFPVYTNVDGTPVTDARRARKALLEQLSNPVRWTEEVTALASRYPGAVFVEMGAGSVLVGLVKKIVPAFSGRTATCGTAAEVAQLMELVAQ